MDSLVSVEWLAEHIGDDDIVLLRAILAKPKGVNTDSLTANEWIPGSVDFDIEKDFSDNHSDLPHMLPGATEFTTAARALGITAESKVVVYDCYGIYSSPRAWWMFRVMGHDQVAVLNGGLPAWKQAGFGIDEQAAVPETSGDFRARWNPELIANMQQVHLAIDNEEVLIVDARSKGRFEGTSAEPRPGLRGGHIPGSKNIPFPEVLAGTSYRSPDQLHTIFESVGTKDQHLLFSCGSGVTASILALAADQAGFRNFSVYDGSWSEWGRPGDWPVEVR